MTKNVWLVSVFLWSVGYGAMVSAEVVSEERSVTGFEAVVVSGAGRLELTQGSTESLVIDADGDVLETITTRVEGGVLHIGRKNRSWFHIGWTKPIVYHLQFETLNSLALSGSIRAVADEITADSLQVKLSGSGGVDIEALETADFTVTVSGSGSVKIKTLETDEFVGRISAYSSSGEPAHSA